MSLVAARDAQRVPLGLSSLPKMPAYLRYFDGTLIPFAVGGVIVNSNPLKLKEYLAGRETRYHATHSGGR